ncbi:MAG: DUF3127 domain-containing protein [Paludibacteraceae bacterium]|nr:DUF3127 domain-containing protein [Paludibacteraceae bacterium]
MSYTASGRVIAVCQEEHGVSANTQKTWRKQTFVIETLNRDDDPNIDDRFRHKIAFDVRGDNIDAYKKYYQKDGELFDLPPITVLFEIESRPYGNGDDERWFTTNTAFSVREYTGAKDIRDVQAQLVQSLGGTKRKD